MKSLVGNLHQDLEPKPSEVHLPKLPEELIVMIFGYLSCMDLVQCSYSSHLLRNCALDNEVLKKKSEELGLGKASLKAMIVYLRCVEKRPGLAEQFRKASGLGDELESVSLAFSFLKGIKGFDRSERLYVHFLEIAAEKGNSDAQFNLGVAYKNGQGIPECDQTAMDYFLLAAKKNHTKAIWNIGEMYAEGCGVTQSKKTAFIYFQRAAELGDMEAQASFGILYDEREKYEKALHFYTLAAEQENPIAEYRLGVLFQHGRGCEKNNKKAFSFYLRSAEKSEREAQYNVAVFYYHGIGTKQSLKRAAKFFKLAAEDGDELAQYNLSKMYESGEGVKKSKKLASKWMKRSVESTQVI